MKGFNLTLEQAELWDDEIIIDGFVFVWAEGTTYMIIHNPPEGEQCGGIMPYSRRTIEDHVQFINDNNVEHLVICRQEVSFLRHCPRVTSVSLTVPALCDSFDFSPFYDMESLVAFDCCLARDIPELSVGIEVPKLEDKVEREQIRVDFTMVKGLKQIEMGPVFKGAYNFEKIPDLECLKLEGCKEKELRYYFVSERLKYLDLYDCPLKNLNGIERARELQWMVLDGMTKLEDLSALESVADSLEALEIDHCGKIKDFSVLSKLKNLKHLELIGKNKLENLRFLDQMKKLETFTFNMNVEDGDLAPCLRIPYVKSENNRKHYNLKDRELPKAEQYQEWGWQFQTYPGLYDRSEPEPENQTASDERSMKEMETLKSKKYQDITYEKGEDVVLFPDETDMPFMLYIDEEVTKSKAAMEKTSAVLDKAEQLEEKAKEFLREVLSDKESEYGEDVCMFMEFHRDDMEPDEIEDVFPDIDPKTLSFTEMADYLKIKRLGVSIEEEPDELSIELDLSFNPEATDYVLLVVFNEKEEIIHVASES